MKKFLLILAFLLIVPMFLPVSSDVLPDINNSQIDEKNHSLPEYQEESNVQEYDITIEVDDEIDENHEVKDQTPDNLEDNNSGSPRPEKIAPEEKLPIPRPPTKPIKQTPLPTRNKETDNLNILFLGADKEQLLMTAIYSIDYKDKKGNLKSGSIFFPSKTGIEYNGQPYTLQSLYKQHPEKDYGYVLVEILEELLEIEIAYHVHMDKAILIEANRILDPIIVDDQRINLEDIFEMPATNKDQEVLGQLMEQFTRPTTFFYKLPALVIKSSRYIDTDFPLTPENLLLHFRIAREVNMKDIEKVILDKNSPETSLKDIIYTITTP